MHVFRFFRLAATSRVLIICAAAVLMVAQASAQELCTCTAKTYGEWYRGGGSNPLGGLVRQCVSSRSACAKICSGPLSLGGSVCDGHKIVEATATSWKNTGIQVTEGQKIRLESAIGLWTGRLSTYFFHGFAGPTVDVYNGAANYPFPGQKENALVLRVGGQKVLMTTAGQEVVAGGSGEIQLTMNDAFSGRYDNRGSVAARLVVSD